MRLISVCRKMWKIVRKRTLNYPCCSNNILSHLGAVIVIGGILLFWCASIVLPLFPLMYLSLSDSLRRNFGDQCSDAQVTLLSILEVIAILLVIGYFLWRIYFNDDRSKYHDPRKKEIDVRTTEELLEVFVRWISDDYWIVDSKDSYLDFTTKEVRQQIPCWRERKSFFKSGHDGEGCFWLGYDSDGNSLDYHVHFSQEDWTRFSQLYDEHRKTNDDWSDWWGHRWANLYASIVADKVVLRRVYDWCNKSDGKRKKPASTYLQEVLDQMRIDRPTAESTKLRLRKGQCLDMPRLEGKLQKLGYRRTDFVVQEGQYAVRGSLMDVFSFGGDAPFRIDFFDDEVDSIRTFTPQTQQTQTLQTSCAISGPSVKGECKNRAGDYNVHQWYEPYVELFNKQFTIAEDMLKYMLTFFSVGFWQGSHEQEEILGDSYREMLTSYFEITRKDNPGMLLALSDAEWIRLKRLLPKLIKEDEMRDIINDTLEVRIGHVIDQKVGRSARAVIVHDMLEPFA